MASSALRALVRVPSPGFERSSAYERPASPRYMQPTIASATRAALTVGVPDEGGSFTRSDQQLAGFARDGSPSRRRSPSPHLLPPAGGSPNNRSQGTLDFGLGEEPRRRIRRTLSAPRPHFSRREKSDDSLIRYAAIDPAAVAPAADRGDDGRLVARGDAVLDAAVPAVADATGGARPMASLAALGAALAPDVQEPGAFAPAAAPATVNAPLPGAAAAPGALTARHDALSLVDQASAAPSSAGAGAGAPATYAVEVRGESPPRSLPRPPAGWLTSSGGGGVNANAGSHDKSIPNAPRSRRSPGRFRPDARNGALQVTPGALAAASAQLVSDAGFDSSVVRGRARGSCSPHAYRPVSAATASSIGGGDPAGGGGGEAAVPLTTADPNQNRGARFPTAAGFGLASSAARSVLSPSRKGRGSCSPQALRPGSAAGRVTAADALRWD